MARPSSEFEVAWRSLKSNGELSGWRTIAVASSGARSLVAGRRSPGDEEALLVGFPNAALPISEKLPDGLGFSVERVDPYGDGVTWLALTRKTGGNTGLFTTMVCDVAGSLDDEKDVAGTHALRCFLGRVRAWQEFMRKGAQPLSAEAEIGLFGEITFLAALIAAGVPPSVSLESWVGPLDAVQDFELGTGAVEVKSTLSSLGFPAKIGSLEQLDDAVRQPLFVAGVRLRQTENQDGRTLPQFVDAMRCTFVDDMGAARRFSERLVAVGYFDVQADRYSRRFALRETTIMQVSGSFPRLTGGNVPAGVIRAAYEIDLGKVASPALELGPVLKLLGVL